MTNYLIPDTIKTNCKGGEKMLGKSEIYLAKKIRLIPTKEQEIQFWKSANATREFKPVKWHTVPKKYIKHE